ncbi:MAG TPA: AAA family ATPase [Methylomirabilota bacterium]|nr:AAA family ATPase [Methylomirabilota bacterium]
MSTTLTQSSDIAEPNGSDALLPSGPTLGPEARAAQRFSVPGDIVQRVTADLPEEQRTAIRWLHGYAREKNLGYQEIGAKLKRGENKTYDGNTVYRILNGLHEAKLDRFCEAVESLRRLEESRSGIHRTDFIETDTTRKMFKVFDAALTHNRFVWIIGASHIGKTEGSLHYKRTHNHGQTKYVRTPAHGRFRRFIECLAKAAGIGLGPTTAHMCRRILDSFDEHMLLIVDEAHQFFNGLGGSNTRFPEGLEFIRELHDTTRCGVAIVATDVFTTESMVGKFNKDLKQFSNRKIATLRLPDFPTREDLNAFAAAYGLEPATGEFLALQNEVVKAESLGAWNTLLQASSKLASNSREKLQWKHVKKAHAVLLAIEKGQWE